MSSLPPTSNQATVGGSHIYGAGQLGARGLGGWNTAVSSRSRRHRVVKDNIQGVTKAAIRKLARRGGVRRMSVTIYEATRTVLKNYLTDILAEVCLVVDFSGRKTIQTKDVVYVLKRRGRTLYGFDQSYVQHRSGLH